MCANESDALSSDLCPVTAAISASSLESDCTLSHELMHTHTHSQAHTDARVHTSASVCM